MDMSEQKKPILLATIFLTVAVAIFLPGLCRAGSLEPTPDAVDLSGNPVPTMKTLDEVLPVWSQKLRADDGEPDGCNSSRFKCVLDGQAVLDKETGLVWEKNAGLYGAEDWVEAKFWCILSGAGGRDGWRLPTAFELNSLREYCPNDNIWLPCGHPFINIQDDYWSATTSPLDASRARYFGTSDGSIGSDSKTVAKHFWCVRGGFGVNYE
jgi:hypothetical protein